jgi:tetratricopeptide (TPR) repeat protein
LPAAREDDALRAVSAALEIRDRVVNGSASSAAVGTRIAVRVGVEAGEVVTGRSVTEVAGEPVQVAVGLERAAHAGEVLLGRDLHALLRGAATVEERDDDEAGALRLVELSPQPSIRSESPLIGRDRELAALRTLYEETVERRCCRLGMLLGPPGIGKTRLALELAAAVEESATVLRGRCLSYGDGITYWPVNEIVRAAVGDDTRAGLERVLEGEENRTLIAERVGGAIGLTEATWSGEETFWAIRRLFETFAKRRALLLIVEDVHWAEPTLVELIEHMSAWTRDAPILVLALARTELVEELPESLVMSAALTIELAPLVESEASVLVASHAGAPGRLHADVITSIVRTAEGNPLFLEQLLAMADEDPQQGLRMSLPPAIHALFAARLDRLSPDERRILECGAVEGIVFHIGPLAQLCPEVGAVAIGRHLLALSRKQLVQPDRATFPGDEALRFRHGLIREVAYESLTQERRALLHERFATVLEEVATDWSLEESGFIGYHLEQAVRYRTELGAEPAAIAELSARSAFFLAAAGRSALGRGDFRAAATLLERAAALLPPQDRERALIEIDQSAALLETGSLAEAETVAAAVEKRMAGDPRISANACAQRLLVRYSLDLGAAITELDNCGGDIGRVFEAESDDRGLYRLLHLRGLVHWGEGQVASAQEAWERASVHAERAGDRVAYVDLQCWLASAAFFGPTPAGLGVERCQDILGLVQDQPYGRARVLHPLAGLHAMTGRFPDAHELLEEANEILGELGLTLQFAVSHPEALVAMLEGDLDRAEKRLREGYELLERMGERNVLSTTAALLARVVLDQGRFDEALHYADRTREICAADDLTTQAIWRGVSARVLAHRGADEQARQLAQEAVAIVKRTDHVRSEGDALADLARVLWQAGDAEGARELGRQASACYERKGDEVSAANMGALIASVEER